MEKPDGRTNVASRLRRAVRRANEALEREGFTPISEGLTPHSLRRTFASLLPLRGGDRAYVMEQLGHTDPKLALRMYTRAMRRSERLGGLRLVGVLDGVEWEARRSAEPSGAIDASVPNFERLG
jgi:integrase